MKIKNIMKKSITTLVIISMLCCNFSTVFANSKDDNSKQILSQSYSIDNEEFTIELTKDKNI